MYKIDAIDAQIISLLNEDGRMPAAEIARQLGDITPRTVGYRIEGLIQRGIVTVRAVVNPKALGYEVLADVLIETDPGRVKAVASILATFEAVTYVACATGDQDISIQVVTDSNEALFDFVTEQIGIIPGVRRTQTHILPFKMKDIDRWLPPEQSILKYERS